MKYKVTYIDDTIDVIECDKIYIGDSFVEFIGGLGMKYVTESLVQKEEIKKIEIVRGKEGSKK